MSTMRRLPPSGEPDMEIFRGSSPEAPPVYYGEGAVSRPDAGRNTHENVLGTFRQILGKRKWTIAGVFVIVVGLVTAATLLMRPKYRAEVKILVNRETSDVLGYKDLRGTAADDQDYSVGVDTQIQILTSQTLALQTIRALHLDMDPRFGSRPNSSDTVHAAVSSSFETDPKRRDALLETYYNGLSVGKAKNTRLIVVSFTSHDPNLSADVANTLARNYVEQNFNRRFDANMQTAKMLNQQLTGLEAKVADSQRRLVEYGRDHGIVGMDEKQNVITERLNDLTKELGDAQSERRKREADYRLTQDESAELIGKEDPESLIQKLHTQEANLRSQYAQATVQYGLANPKVIEINNQIKEIQRQIETEIQNISKRVRNQYNSAVTRENMVSQQLEKQKQEVNQLNQNAIEYTALKHDLEINQKLYEDLQSKVKEAGVSAGLRSSNLEIVDEAHVPSVPAEPNIPRNLAAGVLAGLVGGIALALVRDRFDRTLRSTHQLRTLSELPSLGVIPKEPAHGPMLVSSNPISLMAESYRMALNSILLSRVVPPTTILVTSAVTKEGKTSTSINLAIILARQGKRVLLLDADLRKPSVHKALRLPEHEGLTSLLKIGRDAGASADTLQIATENVIVQVAGVPNLFVLPAGNISGAEAELANSDVMRKLLSEWRSKYDHIIIDTPPVLMASDAVRLSVEADAVILVVRAGYTTEEAFFRAKELLMQVNAATTGVILNAADLNSPDLSYYGEYGYASGPVTRAG